MRRHFHSPVPDLRELPEGFWESESPLHGLDFDPDRHLQFIVDELSPAIAEFDPPMEPTGEPGSYFMRNGFYGGVDAQLLYGMIRRFRPRRLMELGSGYSSLVVDLAMRRNEADGYSVDYRIADPFPSALLTPQLRTRAHVEAKRAEDVELGTYAALEAGDILLVDTTHTVKIGGDVTFLVLEVLPLLRPDVLVHFHDVFLPWQYPRAWFVDHEWYWAEQYLLQAFLAFNSAYEVVVSAQAVARKHPKRLAEIVPAMRVARETGEYASLWIRRRRTGST